MDVVIRAGLVVAQGMLCYQLFSPLVALMAWALILAVTLYPAQPKLHRGMGGRPGLAATTLVPSAPPRGCHFGTGRPAWRLAGVPGAQ
jgi:predicted PurR-regulated permease PerM